MLPGVEVETGSSGALPGADRESGDGDGGVADGDRG